MPQTSDEQIEAFLRQVGLIPPNYSGQVEVTASTAEGEETRTITV
jgi:hypothetical protein